MSCSGRQQKRRLVDEQFSAAYNLRIDTGGWSVHCGAPFNESSIKCSLLNYYMLDIIK